MIFYVNYVQKDKFIILIHKNVKTVQKNILSLMEKIVIHAHKIHNLIELQNNVNHVKVEPIIIQPAVHVYVRNKHHMKQIVHV
jgi:hypothetical protein